MRDNEAEEGWRVYCVSRSGEASPLRGHLSRDLEVRDGPCGLLRKRGQHVQRPRGECALGVQGTTENHMAGVVHDGRWGQRANRGQVPGSFVSDGQDLALI